jgi:hypothetical protein
LSKFSFGADWQGQDRFTHAVNELAEGRLPGKLGLLQQVVGHWAIPKNDRGLFQYGKAALDTLGSVLSYRESQKQVVDGGRDAGVVWLADNDYLEAFPSAGWSFTTFVGGALSSLDYTKQSIRDGLGRPSTSVLLRFEIAPETYAFYIDLEGNSPKKFKSSKKDSHWSWDGPFVKTQDYDKLIEFIRDEVWRQMGTGTTLLSCEQSASGDRIQISAMDDELDFCSGKDRQNDVVEMAKRCKLFMDTGRCRSLLFYGPPGTGKSTLARAIARELKRRVVIIEHDAIRLMSSSAHRIISIMGPGVLVLNDVDRGVREANISLLQALERENKDQPLLTCITVNDIKQLDPAILRPGRIHETRDISEPGEESRRLILDYYIKKFGFRLSEEEVEEFMKQSEGFSPSDVREFCVTALAVGNEIAIQEIERIKKQRKLYAGTACADYNEKNASSGPSPY